MKAARPTRRAVLTTVIAVLLVGAGIGLGNATFRALGGVAVAALLVAVVPTLSRVRPAVTREVTPVRVERGDPVTARLIVRNESATRAPAFVAVDRIDGRPVEIGIPALPAGGAHHHEITVPTARRGRIELGPVTATRSDPFGMIRTAAGTGQVDHIWVSPKRHDVRVRGGGRLRHHHDGQVPEQPLRGSHDIRHLRDYVPGDELRHVHWRATARAGHLVVRDYVDPVRPQTTVVLDTRQDALPPDVFEEAVEVAASVLWSALSAGHDVVLRTADGVDVRGGDQPETAQPLLDRLAAVAPHPGGDLGSVLESLSGSGDGGWLVLAGGATDAGVHAHLVALRRFSPITIFDVSGWPEGPHGPGVTTVRAGTAREAVERWNGLP